MDDLIFNKYNKVIHIYVFLWFILFIFIIEHICHCCGVLLLLVSNSQWDFLGEHFVLYCKVNIEFMDEKTGLYYKTYNNIIQI